MQLDNKKRLSLCLATLVTQGCASDTGAPSSTPLWGRGFGDELEQSAMSIATDAAGNTLVTGYFEGTVDFGGGPLTSAGNRDMLLAKLDADGAHLWSQGFGDPSNQQGSSITVDAAGNVLITGNFEGTVDFGGDPLTNAGSLDMFVAKLDPSGAHLWSKSFGVASIGSSVRPESIATDAAGNVLITGSFEGTVDFGGDPLTSSPDSYAIFVAKLDPSGAHLWSQSFGSGATLLFMRSRSIGADAAGNVLVTGCFENTVDFGGGPLTSVDGPDIFVAKLDADGAHLWSKSFGGAGFQTITSSKTDAAGNLLVTGYFDGTVDLGGGPLTGTPGSREDGTPTVDSFVAKLSADGAHLWSRSFGDQQDQFLSSLALDAAGNLLVAGNFEGTMDVGGGPLTSAGDRDMLLAKLDADGAHLWSQGFGDAAAQSAGSIATDAAGNAVVTGYFEGTMDVGGGPLTSAGDWDIFVFKLIH